MPDTDPKIHQHCDICGVKAEYVPESAILIGPDPDHGAIVSQCSRCLRFFCHRHAQYRPCRMPDAMTDFFRSYIASLGSIPVVLCCPYHRSPLGQFADMIAVFPLADKPADEFVLEYARGYLADFATYLVRLDGLDLRDKTPSPPWPRAWPTDRSRLAILHKAVQAGLDRYRKGPRTAAPGGDGTDSAPFDTTVP